jgi:RNA polymerase sigma-70 factor (ECF subfamily)
VDDANGFSMLYRSEGEAVLVFLARRTLDAELALELTAETFATALESWSCVGSLAPEAARAWLFTVAWRLYGRYVRKARVERRAIERLGIQVPVVHEEDLAIIEARAGLGPIRAALRDELARLSDGQQAALQLRIVEERPYEEIAARLGISEQTARARVSRGLRGLTAALASRLTDQER